MGKTIEVNLSFENLLDPAIMIADQSNIISVSDSASELSAFFSKNELDALLSMNDCDGIRLYPAANNNEMIMIAVGTNGNDDLIGADYFCLASNASGTVTINGATVVEGVQQVPSGLAPFLIMASGSGTDIVNELNDIRQINQSSTGLKVLFDHTYFDQKDYDSILFEVVDIKLAGTDDLKRSINGQLTKDANVSFELSFLPCPPNCGGNYVVELLDPK